MERLQFISSILQDTLSEKVTRDFHSRNQNHLTIANIQLQFLKTCFLMLLREGFRVQLDGRMHQNDTICFISKSKKEFLLIYMLSYLSVIISYQTINHLACMGCMHILMKYKQKFFSCSVKLTKHKQQRLHYPPNQYIFIGEFFKDQTPSMKNKHLQHHENDSHVNLSLD